ncbi:MAG: DUF1566 domain-containing protein, partial [Campylobacterota bacterium]|nr:DUF1566 domain-containing protein [Campylobacterota bacterium]
MKAILLIMIGFNILYADISKSGNIVSDSLTKLQWQDDAVGSTMSWNGAISFCENLTLDGYSDWRVPNINELKSIVDRSKSNPAIVTGFSHISSNYYWSATTHQGYSERAWIVSFLD